MVVSYYCLLGLPRIKQELLFESQFGEKQGVNFLEPGDLAPKNRLINRVIIIMTHMLIRWKALYQIISMCMCTYTVCV